MKSIIKQALKSKYKYFYIILALIITISILRFLLDVVSNIPMLLICGIVLFIPILFAIGFVMSLMGK